MAIILCEWVTCAHNSCQKPGGKGQCNAELVELKHKEIEVDAYYDEYVDTLDCANYTKNLD